MAAYDFIITIPIQVLTKLIKQMILCSCRINYDKPLNRQTTEILESTYKDPTLHSKWTRAPKGHQGLMEGSWTTRNKITPMNWISKGKHSNCETMLRKLLSQRFLLRKGKTYFNSQTVLLSQHVVILTKMLLRKQTPSLKF